VEPFAGAAGASALRRYEQHSKRERREKETAITRDAEWRDEVVAKRPLLGRVQAALASKPTIGAESQATTAWKTGAAGEVRVAEALNTCEGVVALHDRRIPGSRANIDHLAVSPAGVFVIDAKKYTGAIETRDVGSFFRTDVRLYVGGRDRTKLVDGVLRQVSVVTAALEAQSLVVPVWGVLCFVGGEWPLLFRRPVRVNGVTAVWPLGLQDVLRSKTADETIVVDVISGVLARALPPA
jgi:hypothetical protein